MGMTDGLLRRKARAGAVFPAQPLSRQQEMHILGASKDIRYHLASSTNNEVGGAVGKQTVGNKYGNHMRPTTPVIQTALGVVIVNNYKRPQPPPTTPAGRAAREAAVASRRRNRRAQHKARAQEKASWERTMNAGSGVGLSYHASTVKITSGLFNSVHADGEETNDDDDTHLRRRRQPQRRPKERRKKPLNQWMHELEFLSLMGGGTTSSSSNDGNSFQPGKGKPFSSLVRHMPSGRKLTLQVVPVQTSNMFLLARQCVVALRVDHPYVHKCIASAQVKESVHFLWEHAPTRLCDVVCSSESDSQLSSRLSGRGLVLAQEWIRQIVSALGHLHGIGIVHRDVCTENILLAPDLEPKDRKALDIGSSLRLSDEEREGENTNDSLTGGSIRLSSFGISKYLAPRRRHNGNSHGPGEWRNVPTQQRTATICGNARNMSPERVLGQQHGFGADWWCLGLVIHEVLCGIRLFPDDYTPARKDATGILQPPKSLYEAIVECRYNIQPAVAPGWADVISRLCAAEPQRLGCDGPQGTQSSSAEVEMFIASRGDFF